MNDPSPESLCYISVDVESAGPSPSHYALLSIGAVTVYPPERAFYVELQPDRDAVRAEALAISGLSLDALARHGAPPEEGMRAFATWLDEVTPDGSRPLMVGLNVAFDWMFVCDYFHRYLGRNPFGHSALDMKSLFVGLSGVGWAASGMRGMSAYFGIERTLTHHALEDARLQATLLRRLLDELGDRHER